ncbi:MAG: hypothetical protein H0T43_09425 [Solirubrobacterales bacterium]|nr:hypothetical protein [Solirubrobacterales bacterium]
MSAADRDESIRVLLTRLARPHRSGGRVVERATLLAEGADFAAVMTWIEAHGGEPEAPAAARSHLGLHGERLDAAATEPTPLRFILPAAALG